MNKFKIFIGAVFLLGVLNGCSVMNPGYLSQKPEVKKYVPYKTSMKKVTSNLGTPAISRISVQKGKVKVINTYFYKTPNAIVDTKKMIQGNYKDGCKECGKIIVYSKYKDLLTGIRVEDTMMYLDFNKAMGLVKHKKFNEAYPKLITLADNHFSPAQHILGLMYINGDGVKKNYSKAATYFAQSAASEYPPALYDLAIMYKNGEGIPKNLTAAITLLEESGNLSNRLAMSELIKIYKAIGNQKKVEYWTNKIKK
jgi:hypothetical protein